MNNAACSDRPPLGGQRWLRWFCLAGWLSLGWVSAGFAQTLSSPSPGALASGATTEIVLRGAKLTRPLKIWTSFSGRVEIIEANPKKPDPAAVHCRISLPAGTPMGLAGIAVANESGASDILPLLIDDLPSIADGAANSSAAAAQVVTLPCAIDGVGGGVALDYFRFSAKAGQSIALEVYAARLAQDFDAVIRILSADGKELLLLDDDSAAGADARGLFTAPADGDYLIELRDNRYKAGGRYRLRLGDFPLLVPPRPLGVATGSVQAIAPAGLNIGGIAPLSLYLPSDSRGRLPLEFRRPGGAAGATWLLASDLSTVLESGEAPANQPSAATTFALPAGLEGVLNAPGDRDEWEFAGKKGERVTFRAITRSVGSPSILSLKLKNAAGAQVAETAVSDSEEDSLPFAIPADGLYRLVVSDLAGRGGPEFVYRVEGRLGASFGLALKNDKTTKIKFVPAAGGALALDVQVQRNGYDGPVQLAVDSARPGWRLVNAVIGAKAAETRLYLLPPADLAAGDIAPVRIVGRAEIDGAEVAAVMSTVVQMRLAAPAAAYPAPWQEGLIVISGGGAKPNFYSLAPKSLEVFVPSTTGQAVLTLQMNRLDAAYKDPLVVLPQSLPPGFTAEVKRNGNGPQETYDIALKGPANAPAGVHTLSYFAYGELTGRGQAVLSGDLVVRIAAPLAVSAVPAGPLLVGQKQKVKLTLTRNGDEKQPVAITFKALPAGVTAPEKMEIAADQSELEVELTAAPDAAPVMFKELVAVATSKYAGQPVVASSAPVPLEVKKP